MPQSFRSLDLTGVRQFDAARFEGDAWIVFSDDIAFRQIVEQCISVEAPKGMNRHYAAFFPRPKVHSVRIDDNGNIISPPSAECRVPSAECRVPSAECRVPSAECRVPSAECPVPSAQCPTPSLHFATVPLRHFATLFPTLPP